MRRLRLRQKPQQAARDIDIWRVKAIFNNFRRIFHINTNILKKMAEMDRALGGEYIFDIGYLEEAVRIIASHVHHVTYNLNALTEQRHIDIYDKYQEIRTLLDDVLVGNYQSLYCPPVLPLHTLGWELEPLVGLNLICLAELRHHHAIQPADGVALTCTATRALCEDATEDEEVSPYTINRTTVEQDLRAYLQEIITTYGRPTIAVGGCQINEEMAEIHNLGDFLIIPAEDRQSVSLCEEATQFDQLLPGRSQDKPHATPHYAAKAITLTINADNLEEQYLLAIQKATEQASARLITHDGTAGRETQNTGSGKEPAFALYVRVAPPLLASGTVTTRLHAEETPEIFPLLNITAHPAGQPDQEDNYQLKRLFPFTMVSSRICPRPADFRYPQGNLCSTHNDSGRFLRGSALLTQTELRALAETAMSLERIMGVPVALRWEFREDGSMAIIRLSPLIDESELPEAATLAEEIDNSAVLAEGGRVVQSGVAAGSVVHVDERTNPTEFPVGAIAVAGYASPRLSPILHRAAAILTEHGNPIGHLATVARELSLPALFGIPGIVDTLKEGTEITIDAGMGCVFQGVVNALVQLGKSEASFSPADPEYRLLRRLLRFITPLNLVDPDDSNFSAEQCRSFHDIIHFCHETAVDELAHFQERRPELSGLRTTRFTLPLPLEINLLDIGDGLHSFKGNEPTFADIRSEPFAVFLDGMLHPMAKNDLPQNLSIRDLFAAIPKNPSGQTERGEDDPGNNLSIISYNYMNLSLRLGYHFSVIDAHLSSDRHRNHIYFRFVGGLASPEKRARRARFIANVLRTMDFKVERKDDLVIGRMKFEQKSILRSALFVLGALTTFTRQRDTEIDSDDKLNELFSSFADSFLLPFGVKSAAPQPQRGEQA